MPTVNPESQSRIGFLYESGWEKRVFTDKPYNPKNYIFRGFFMPVYETMNKNYAASAQAQEDKKCIRRVLKLASKGRGSVHPNPMVGCAIVKNGRAIAEGYHQYPGGPHAEIVALRKAKDKNISLKNATMYVNLEPCCHHKKKTPPCVPEIIKSRVKRVVMAMRDPNPQVRGKGIKELQAAGIECIIGMHEQEAKELNKFYVKWITKGIPYVLMKWAMSLDGKIAARTGDAKWISCPEAREYVHKMRAGVDAVLVGIGTVLKDNPKLTVRLGEIEGTVPDLWRTNRIFRQYKNPIRVIIDPGLKISPEAKVIGPEAKTIIFHHRLNIKAKLELLNNNNCKTVYLQKNKNGTMDFKQIMRFLGGQNISSVLIEGGGNTNARALNSGVVDEVFAFISPKIIGGENAITPVEGNGISKIGQATRLKDIKIEKIGCDFLLSGKLQRGNSKGAGINQCSQE